MIRGLQTIVGKNADAMCTADVAMVRGMGVQKSGGEAILPAAETCANIFFVTKETIPTGLLSIQGELSEYTSDFETIAIGEPVVLIKPMVGERYATNQYATSKPAAGAYLMVGTDGKFVTATTSDVSTFYCEGNYDDAGHACIKFEVVEPHTV